jgi:hypothetical protein
MWRKLLGLAESPLLILIAVAVLAGLAALFLLLWLRRARKAEKPQKPGRITCLLCGRRRRITKSMLEDGFFICRCGQKVLVPDPEAMRRKNRL